MHPGSLQCLQIVWDIPLRIKKERGYYRISVWVGICNLMLTSVVYAHSESVGDEN